MMMITIIIIIIITRSKFEWTLDNIRKEKIILASIWATKLFLEVSALLEIRLCLKLQSRKTNDGTFRKW